MATPVPTPLGNTGGFTYDRLVAIFENLAETALILGGLVAMGAIAFYGLQMSFSKAEPKRFNDAKNALIKAAIGLVLIAGVYTLIATVQYAADTLTK